MAAMVGVPYYDPVVGQFDWQSGATLGGFQGRDRAQAQGCRFIRVTHAYVIYW